MSDFWKSVLNRRMLICIFTGFASGMPLYVLIQLVPAWLRDEGVGLAEIGFFALIQLPYTWKFIWAPFFDRYWVKRFGRRRSWMLATQIPLIASIALLPYFDTESQLFTIAYLAAVVAFFSASQDVVLDAYRREILPDEELGMGNSMHVNAYRVSGLIPGSLSLILADHFAWTVVFPVTALFMLVGVGLTLSIKEPSSEALAPKTLRKAVAEPFIDFFERNGISSAILILCFMFLYKLGDSMAVALQTPFFLDSGYSMTEIGLVAKNAGLWASVLGGITGGLLMIKIGINRGLWLFGFVQIASILGFALLARSDHSLWLLGAVIAFEYLGVGLGAAAFVAFIARSTSRAHTATQLALLTALTALPRSFASATTGVLVEKVGWESFFYLCAIIAIPGMLLLFKVAPWNQDQPNLKST
jgi:PAT family beta-lactamase induction signal transducer AmpG